MERETIRTALAVDDHFTEAGFRVVPAEKRR
jgi:predicted nucleic acid-binding protein